MGVLSGVVCDASKVNPAVSYEHSLMLRNKMVLRLNSEDIVLPWLETDLHARRPPFQVRLIFLFFLFFVLTFNYNSRVNVANVLSYIF